MAHKKIRDLIREELRKVMYVNREDILYEGLIFTEDLSHAAHLLRQWGPRKTNKENSSTKKLNIIIDEETNTLLVDISWFDENDLHGFLELSNNLGYFISEFGYRKANENGLSYEKYSEELLKEYINDKENIVEIIVTLEAKFDIEIIRGSFPEKLYHLCPQDNLKKILEIGLVPRSGSKLASHPERIYFAYSANNALSIGKNFKNKKMLNKNGYALLEIDVSKINSKFIKEDKLRIFEDPNFKKYGVYIMVNVHPDAITVLKENIQF